jgi:hypothetical protein
MIKELLKTEVDDAIEKIKDFEGLNFVYKNDNSNSIFNYTDNQLSTLFNFNNADSLSEIHRQNKLIKWNQEISIKIINLRNTFIYLNTFYSRFIRDNAQLDQQYFRYFGEVMSYFFVSVRDNILQLLNAYFYFPIKEEHKVKQENLEKKLKELKKHKRLCVVNRKFETKTKKYRVEVRNNFTHRSSPFSFYYETKLEGDKELSVNYKAALDNEELLEETLKALSSLSEYIIDLRKILK